MQNVLVALHLANIHADVILVIMEMVLEIHANVCFSIFNIQNFYNCVFYYVSVHYSVCPNGTYWQSWNLCRPCPDINHITVKLPATSIDDCVCKMGFKTSDVNRCEVITCPKLSPPTNGYFVKHPTGCGHVLNAACGARCKSGFQLVGSSIRLCQENGTWSGTETNCVCK